MSRVDATDAKARHIVRLPDGRQGVLMWVSPDSGIAKVRVAGRHVRVPVVELAPTGEYAT